MTNYTNPLERKRLENLYNLPEQKQVKESKVVSLLNNLWQHIVTAITKRQEPQIWQSTDRYGNIWWHGYDPVTDSSVSRDSEDEMRVWLEERYYQSTNIIQQTEIMNSLR
jgi:hypothetical protein